MNDKHIATIVLGGTGYVAGELLRLIAGHPHLHLAAAVSESKWGDTIKSVFPHLQFAFGEQTYVSRSELPSTIEKLSGQQIALFSAAPHGASATIIHEALMYATKYKANMTVVDASADFRFASANDYSAVYGLPHGAPELLPSFSSALPEHVRNPASPHVGHPGCFATAMLLGAVPLLALDIVRPAINAVGITGSTGSGRSPMATTHHPFRQSNLYAYKALNHRHAPEVTAICEQVSGVEPELHFIPHSGPFARGIHMTLQATLKSSVKADDIKDRLAEFYTGKPFVEVVDGTPRIKDVAGSNYAHIGVATDAKTVAVFIAIDNLLKGAAGGAVQWMNIKLAFDESAGLTAPGPGWI